MSREAGGQHRCAFGFRGLRIEVASNIAPPLLWLQEFLHPHFDDRPEDAEVREIRLSVDARLTIH